MNPITVYRNADIVTMNPRQSSARALAVLGDRLMAVGTEADVLARAGEGAGVVDLTGRAVLPGFLETHNHLSWYSMHLDQADCTCTPDTTIDDILDRIRDKAREAAPGTWVMGHSFDDTLVAEKRHLTRRDLDRVSPDHPTLIVHVSVHLAYANSVAMKMAGIDRNTPQPDGGEIHMDADGEPSGLLLEPGAILPFMSLIPQPGLKELKDLLARGAAEAVRLGVTGVHDAAIGAFGNGPQLYRAYRELASEGRLGLRAYLTTMHPMYDFLSNLGLGTGFGTDDVKMGSVKLLQDGSIQGLTAALSQPYHNRRDDGFCSRLIMPQETLDELVLRYHQEGLQVAIHGNGDAAIESIILAVERAQAAFPRSDPRHMLVHAQTIRPDQIPRLKQAGMVPSYFVNHVYYWGDRHVSTFLGPERAARISPLATTLAAGVPFTLHSDLPVTRLDPLHSIHHAVNRITKSGEVLGPEERISPLDAIRAFTTMAAYVSFEEGLKGSLEPGKLADFIVLDANPLTAPPDSIKDIEVLRTVTGGRTVFAADGVPPSVG